MRKSSLVVSLCLLLMLAAACSFASVTVYPDLASWNANVSQVTTIDFSGFAPSSGVAFVGPVTISGVTFQPSPVQFANLYVDGAGYQCCHITAPGAPFTLFEQNKNDGPAMLITLPPNVTAISFRVANGCEPVDGFHCLTPNGGTIKVSLSDGTTLTVQDVPGGAGRFVGFTSPIPISSISISTTGNLNNNWAELASFRFGSALFSTRTSLDVCRRQVNPGQPVCFSSLTSDVTKGGLFPVDDGTITFIDELSRRTLGTANVNQHGVAYLCLPINQPVEVYARYADHDDYDGRPSVSNEVPVFTSATGVFPGCLIHK